MSFVVDNGRFQPTDKHCRSCGAEDTITCYPGRWPQCWNCNAKLIYLGKTPEAECVTPSGLINKHGRMIKGSGKLGDPHVCAFCNKL